MLAARSYSRELIIGASLGGAAPVRRQLRQWVASLRALGMDHMVLLAMDERGCRQEVQQLGGAGGSGRPVGCAWDSSPCNGEHIQDVFQLWMWRYRLLARLARLGYGVLMTDTDTHFFDSPYRYFKQPPFSDYHMFAACEHSQPEACLDLNGGFLYIQSTRPDGPVAYALHQMIERMLRWSDDPKLTFLAERLGCPTQHYVMNMDQVLLNDVVRAMVVRRPAYWAVVEACVGHARASGLDRQRPELQQLWDAAARGVAIMRRTFRSQWMGHQLRLSQPHMLQRAGLKRLSVVATRMSVPNSGGRWPNEYGGDLLPPGLLRGPASAAWAAQLESDCPGCAFWPDERNASLAAAAAALQESFLLCPGFLVHSWWHRGRLGLWAGSPPQQVRANWAGWANTHNQHRPAYLHQLCA